MSKGPQTAPKNYSYNPNLVRPNIETNLIIIFCALTIAVGIINLILHSCFKRLRLNTGGSILSIIIS